MLLFLVHKLGLISNDFNPSLSELFAFGALISSTDPVSTLAVFQKKKVNPQLFYLVFGESVLNDALAIVLFESFKKFVSEENNFGTIAIGILGFAFELFVCSIGSLCLGYASGLFAAFIFKTIDMRHHRLLEISLYIVLMYIPFLIAEILNLSGIVTILFTGAAANRYVVPNLSSVTKVNSDMLFRLLSHLAETRYALCNLHLLCYLHINFARSILSFAVWYLVYSLSLGCQSSVSLGIGIGALLDGHFYP
jgi:sodium/hydrogen exchanger 8